MGLGTMELLTAVNLILPVLGEHPVTNVNQKHPTLAVILPVIEQTRREVLNRGWWFNEYQYTVYPDSEGICWLPSTTLRFTPDDRLSTVRGNRLYSMDTLSFQFTEKVVGILIEDVVFNELPESVANTVLYGAMVSAYMTDIGMEQVVQAWAGQQQQALAMATAEHLRNKQYSTKKSPRFRRIKRAMRG